MIVDMFYANAPFANPPFAQTKGIPKFSTWGLLLRKVSLCEKGSNVAVGHGLGWEKPGILLR